MKEEDWIYLENFFNGLEEAREDLKDEIPDLTYRSLGEFTKVYSNYTNDIDKLKAQDINPYDFSRINELEGLHIAVVNLYENALEFVGRTIGEEKMAEYLPPEIEEIGVMDVDEFKDWQKANKWVDTMKKSDDKIIAAAKLLIDEGGRNEKEKKDIETMKIALQYNDIESVKTLIQSFPQGMEFKSEGWFNTLKDGGAVTSTSPGQSALQNKTFQGFPDKKEDKEFPIVVEDADFWRD